MDDRAERAAMKAAGASQQTVESAGTSHVPMSVETDKPRAKKAAAPGLTFQRFFTEAGVDPFDEIEWELRSAVIGSQGGEVVFEQRDVEIPKSWSQQATNRSSRISAGRSGRPSVSAASSSSSAASSTRSRSGAATTSASRLKKICRRSATT